MKNEASVILSAAKDLTTFAPIELLQTVEA
jgi:hypothetical protein